MPITDKGIQYGMARGTDWLDIGNRNYQLFDAYSVDQWSTNIDTTVGLSYGYHGGIARSGAGLWVVIAADTVALTDGATNYVERTTAGVVSANTVDFTAASMPMAVVITAAGAITSITDRRVFASLDPTGAAAIPSAEKGAANGVATLGADSKIPTAQLPALAIDEFFTAASQAAMLALVAQRGDVVLRTDLSGSRFVLTSDSPGTLADWVELVSSAVGVTAFNGRTGAVAPVAGDYDAADVGAVPLTSIGANGGVAPLGSDGLVPEEYLPDSSAAFPDDALRKGFNNTLTFPSTSRPAEILDGMGSYGPYTVNEASPTSQNYGAPYNSRYFAINVTAAGTLTVTLATTAGNLSARVYGPTGVALGAAAYPFTATISTPGTYYIELVNVDPHTPSTTGGLTLSGTATLEPFNAAAAVLDPISPPFEALVDGATVTWTTTNKPFTQRSWLAAGNRTLEFVGVNSGYSGRLAFRQDATGGRTITYPAGSIVCGAPAAAANAYSACRWWHDGTRFWFEWSAAAFV